MGIKEVAPTLVPLALTRSGAPRGLLSVARTLVPLALTRSGAPKGLWRRGQALMELACGMFALALVVSALCGFAIYIVKSLGMQNDIRVGASSQHGQVDVGDFASEYVFGTATLQIHEKVEMPPTVILK